LYSLKVKGTGKGYKGLEEASSKGSCVCVAILILQIFAHNKLGFVFKKISIFIKLIGKYLH
jgi:hypothetical protein